jgi:3-hydroxyacyl-[acyl-carrier-protein] dehydratase
MLLNDLYTIEQWAESKTTAGEVRAVLVLNATHPIFAGHFPGQPVVPGACQLQMVEELLSHVLDREFRLVNAAKIKFLTPIDPLRHPRIEAVLQYALDGPFQVTATFSAADASFLKLNGIFGAA